MILMAFSLIASALNLVSGICLTLIENHHHVS
jgi:hypothetical protein